MINSGPASRPVAVSAQFQSLVRFTGCCGLVITLLATVAAAPLNPLNPDEQYIRIMAIIDRADALRKAGQADAAHARYLEAEKALLAFKAANPLFAPKTVAYRLKEVTDQADTRPAVPETNSPTKAPKANLEAEPAAAKSGVKLVEAGAEPRSVLRYHVKAGDKQTAIMTMKFKLDMSAAGAAAAGAKAPNIPTISIPMDIAVQNVAANGDITYQMVMGEASMAQDTNTAPEVAQQMQTQLAAIKGLTGTGVLTSRGLSKKFDMKAPANVTDQQARQLMDQLKDGTSNFGIPLPEEAVGAGAKWEFKKAAKVQNISVENSGTYELVSLEGDKVSMKFNADFDANSPAGKTPTAGLKIGGNITGTTTLNLSKVMAPTAEMNTHLEMPVSTDKNAGSVTIDLNMAMDAQ
jgi:hypothetical protein